ncbi:MAG TPA: M55 family metallopeptidase, partial [Gaiellaceae bacterium]
MKVFIVSDMEGVAGIVKWGADGRDEGEARLPRGARALHGGDQRGRARCEVRCSNEIVVMDCHGAGGEWTFNSLIPDKFDPDCEYVVQNDWTEYTELLSSGCDAALFVGMHAKGGTPDGVMSHTVSGQAW